MQQRVATHREGTQRVICRQGVNAVIRLGSPNDNVVGVRLRHEVADSHIHRSLGCQRTGPVVGSHRNTIHHRIHIEGGDGIAAGIQNGNSQRSAGVSDGNHTRTDQCSRHNVVAACLNLVATDGGRCTTLLQADIIRDRRMHRAIQSTVVQHIQSLVQISKGRDDTYRMGIQSGSALQILHRHSNHIVVIRGKLTLVI